MKILPVAATALCLVLTSCLDEEGSATGVGEKQASPGQGTQSAAGSEDSDLERGQQEGQIVEGFPVVKSDLDRAIQPWHDDFPYALHNPPRRVGLWYNRNAQQALEQVIENLFGTCTPDAWHMAKEFFDHPNEQVPALMIEKLDETMRIALRTDHAVNILQVIARQKNPIYADVILRAAAHSNPGIRREAFSALVNAGNEAAVMALLKGFGRMSRVEQGDWVKAAARHLSDDNLFVLFREMLTKQHFAGVLGAVFDESMKLPPARARKLFDPIWSSMPEDLQLHVAGVMHAAGDERGTERIRHALKPPIKELKRKIVAVQAAMRGDTAPLVDELLVLTNEDNDSLNVEIVRAIQDLPGQPVEDTLLTLTDKSRPFQVRQRALQILATRGVTGELDQLVEIVRTEPDGAKLRSVVADLVGARYGKAVPAMQERLRKASLKSQIYYIRMIARINRPESFSALREVFLRKEFSYHWRERHTNVSFLGVQFSNLDESVEPMVKLLDELPREDYRRRAALIHALANLAGGRDGAKLKASIYQSLRRRVLDPEELPQVRILALDYMRKDVRLDDAMRLKSMMPKMSTGLRQYVSDYLFEFF